MAVPGTAGRRRCCRPAPLLSVLLVAATTAVAAYALQAPTPSRRPAPGFWSRRRSRGLSTPVLLLSRRGGGEGAEGEDGGTSSSSAMDAMAAPPSSSSSSLLQDLIDEETRDILSVYGVSAPVDRWARNRKGSRL